MRGIYLILALYVISQHFSIGIKNISWHFLTQRRNQFFNAVQKVNPYYYIASGVPLKLSTELQITGVGDHSTGIKRTNCGRRSQLRGILISNHFARTFFGFLPTRPAYSLLRSSANPYVITNDARFAALRSFYRMLHVISSYRRQPIIHVGKTGYLSYVT